MIVATSGHEDRVAKIAEEIERLQWLDIVGRRKPYLSHRNSLVDRNADRLTGILRVDHLRHRADPPDLREHALGAVLHLHRVERQGAS